MFSNTGVVILKELDIGLKITETIMCRKLKALMNLYNLCKILSF